MSWRTSLARWIGGKSLTDQVSSMFTVRGQGAARAGTTELLNSYSQSPWLRSVVGKIADHYAAVPWVLYARKDGKKDLQLQWSGIKAREKLLERRIKQNEVHEITVHPLLNLLSSANPSMSGLAARKISIIHRDLKGESFWLLENNALGKPLEYWPIPPDWVQQIPAGTRDWFEIMLRGRKIEIPADQMIWIRDLDPADPFARGTGYGEALMDEIDTDEYAAKVAKNTFLNKGAVDMLAIIEGADQPTLDEAQARFEQKFRGFNKANRVMWSGGKVELKELQQKFADLQLVELRSWERQAFQTVFGVPPEIIGLLTNSNRATITEAMRIFASEVLVPRLELERAELQRQLIPKYDERLVLDYISPIPDDDDFKLKAMKAAPYTVTDREWRKLQGLKDRGDVDNVHWVPVNLIRVQGPKADALPQESGEVHIVPPMHKRLSPGAEAIRNHQGRYGRHYSRCC